MFAQVSVQPDARWCNGSDHQEKPFTYLLISVPEGCPSCSVLGAQLLTLRAATCQSVKGDRLPRIITFRQ